MRSGEFADIRAILDRSPAMKRIREHVRGGDLGAAWREVAGPTAGKASRARRYRGGKLHVDVFSAALLQELATYRRAELLEALREREGFEGIVDIIFKHGQPDGQDRTGRAEPRADPRTPRRSRAPRRQ